MFFAQDDKRAFKRLRLGMPIEISKGSLTVQGTCQDISSTGMLITFNDETLQAGDQVHIQLATSDTRFPPLDAQAILLRIDAEEVGFSAAVKLSSIQ